MSSRSHVLGLLLVATVVLGGCATLPTAGPVLDGPSQAATDQAAPFDFTPGGPTRGADPVTMADDFLTAMTATPLNTFVAREYLTPESRKSWVPERRTVVYGSRRVVASSASRVSIQLGNVVELDGRGSWLGTPQSGPDQSYSLTMTKVRGQWRIQNPPNTLIIPDSHFTSRYQQYYLYYFDPTGQVLVPEPVWVPGGAQAATVLVASLLRGPEDPLRQVERSYVPAGTSLGDISVPVSASGVAQVPLSESVLEVSPARLPLVFAQLAWTLAQIPGVNRMRLTVDGGPLEIPGEGPDVSVSAWSRYDPRVDFASRELFGVRDGKVEVSQGGSTSVVSTAFAAAGVEVRSIGVDLPGQRFAAVGSDGRQVLVAARTRPGVAAPAPRVVYDQGTDVLQPAYDLYGQLWLVDRTARGAKLVAVRRGRASVVEAPGIDGADVRALRLSREGTRVAVTVRSGRTTRVLVSRVERGSDGRVLALSPARRVPLGPAVNGRPVDLEWRTPGDLAVLFRPSPRTSQVALARVDGSSVQGNLDTASELLRDPSSRIVTSPGPSSPLYLETSRGRLLALAETGRWTGAGVPRDLRYATFVG